MKTPIILKLLILLSINAALGQSRAILHLQKDKLVGDCENRFFSGFVIELDTMYTTIDSATLLGQFPRVGTVNFKNRVDIPTEFTLTERAGFPQIMFRFKSIYLTFDSLSIDKQSISFFVDDDPVVPVTADDLEIVRIAKGMLSEERYWHKEDDRQCADDLANKKYSLYCALRLSSLEIEGKYNHRNAVLQKLRHLIAEKYPNRKWKHRLMDFNNIEETEYKDIMAILNEMERDFMEELSDK